MSYIERTQPEDHAMKVDARFWIQHLGLQVHPEGGRFREVYRARGEIPRNVLPFTADGPRSYSSAIYFLLEAGEVSRFHRSSAMNSGISTPEMGSFFPC